MKRVFSSRCRLIVVVWAWSAAFTLAAFAETPLANQPVAKPSLGPPRPGEVYQEFEAHHGGNRDWRVTDPAATAKGAQQFLPNPVLKIEVADLENAVRAEVVLDRWGGHLRTTDKRIRFNQHAWVVVPEIRTTPHGKRAEYFYSQDNPIVAVPLEHLREGANTFEATCSGLDDYNWGQWGLYSLVLRVYYDPQKKPHPSGRIAAPAAGESFGENPNIVVHPKSEHGVAQVQVVAWYHGYDENGDGVFRDWHRAYFQPRRGEPAAIGEHVGTVSKAPYQMTWNTRWVPDQPRRSVKLSARIQDRRGIWFATDWVENLTLQRTDQSVRLYAATDTPQRFGVRIGQRKSCQIPMPDFSPKDAIEAVLALRTWHGWDGHHQPLELNGHTFAIDGMNHHYDFDLLAIPNTVLKRGANTFAIHSTTKHHMLEVLWPGPALLVRSRKGQNEDKPGAGE